MLTRALIFIALVTFPFTATLSQSSPVKSDRSDVGSPITTARNPFSPGERLSYDVSWADFIVAAELTIETDERRNFDGIDGYRVTAQARTVGLVSGLALKVNDVYESFINASTLQPYRAEKRSRHGKKETQSSVTIDQDKRTAQFSGGRTLEIPGDTYDFAALIFAVRGMDLTLGKTRTITVLEDEKLYTIKLHPEAREKVTTPTGIYDTIKIATSRVKGGQNDKLYNLRIYVTNDTARLPVLITAEPSWGAVRVELTSATRTANSAKAR